MEAKKNLLTREGLKKYEDELHELKVVKRQKQESRATFRRTQSTMRRRTSSATLRRVLRSLRKSSKTWKSAIWMRTGTI